MNCSQARIRIAGYVDGELSSAESSRLGAHVDGCAACKRARSVQSFVSRELRRELTFFTAPSSLQRRVRGLLDASAPRRDPWWRRGAWMTLAPAAGFAMATLLSANLYFVATLPSKDDRVAEEVVNSHLRALMSARAVDVVSSDQHTVKPWFAGKLDFSPPVTDFAAEEFPLAGGRIDYIDGRPVAALVYQRQRHSVDVFVWPATTGDQAPSRISRRGYNVVHWSRGGMSYWMASDLETPELARLEGLLGGDRMR